MSSAGALGQAFFAECDGRVRCVVKSIEMTMSILAAPGAWTEYALALAEGPRALRCGSNFQLEFGTEKARYRRAHRSKADESN